MASEKTFEYFLRLRPEELKRLPTQELERLDKLLGHELEKKRQAEEAGKQLQHLNKELQDYAKQRPDDRPDPYSKLACKVAPDGKTLLAGSVNIYPHGSSAYVAAVGTPDKFTAQTIEGLPRDTPFVDRLITSISGVNRRSVSEKDIGGGDGHKAGSAEYAKYVLKKCDKQLPSL